MRNRISRIAAILLVTTLSASLLGCNSSAATDNNTTTEKNTEAKVDTETETIPETETEAESIYDGENELFNIFYDIDEDGEEETVKCTNRGDEQSHLEIYEAEQITEHIGIPGWKFDSKYINISIMMIEETPCLVVYSRFGNYNIEERLEIVSYDGIEEAFDTKLCLVSIQEGDSKSLYSLSDVQKCDTASLSGSCLASSDMNNTDEVQAYEDAFNTAVEEFGLTRETKEGQQIVVFPSDAETLFESNLVIK